MAGFDRIPQRMHILYLSLAQVDLIPFDLYFFGELTNKNALFGIIVFAFFHAIFILLNY